MRGTSIYQRGSRVVTAFVVAFASVTAFLPFFLTSNTSAAPVVYINEVASAADPEWIELYSPSVSTDISGWKVQFDDSAISQTTTLPANTVIPANGFYVIETQSNWISNGGDTIQVFDTTQNIVDTTTVPANSNGATSHSRTTDGGSNWATGAQTKGTSNNPVFAAPSVTITPATTTVKSGDPDFLSISGTISDTDQRTYTLTVTDPAGTPTTLTSGGTASTITYNGWNTSTLSGTYTLTLTAGDSLGQSGQASAQVLVDRRLPIASISDLSGTYGGTDTKSSISISGSCDEAPCSLQYTLDNGTNSTTLSTTTLDLQARTSDGALVYPSGTYTVSLIATDAAGNTSSPLSTTFTVDNTAPGVSISNDEVSQTGGTIQPNVIVTNPDNENLSYSWVRAANSPNSGALDASETETLQPTFVPKSAGLYRYVLTACDDLKNCSSTVFSFTWEPSVVPVADTAIANAVVSDTTPPAGLVATKFNTTSPTTLGLTSENSAQVSSTTAPVKDEPAPTKDNDLEATYTDDSSARMWWVLLVLAIGAAGYYAYRNWQLTRPKD